MYRDDVCAVCGESLPPDHLYCREHGADVDERLHEIGALLGRVIADAPRLAALLTQVAQETYDWVADDQDDEPEWPPVLPLTLRLAPEDIDVDVDSEPGMVRASLRAPLAALVAAVAAALDAGEAARFAAACGAAEGANATH